MTSMAKEMQVKLTSAFSGGEALKVITWSDHCFFSLCHNTGMPQLGSAPSALPLEWKCHGAELQPSHNGCSIVVSHHDLGVVTPACFTMS